MSSSYLPNLRVNRRGSYFLKSKLTLIGLGPNLTPKAFLDFINAGGNILLTLSSSTPTPSSLVSLLLELDIHLPTERNSLVVDHFNFDSISAAEKHDVVLLPRPDSIRPDIKNFFKGSAEDVIAFPRGVGQSLGNTSPLLTPIIRGPRTAYSYNPKDEAEGVEDPFAAGPQLSLVTTMQARNSARFTVVGSAELLENTWFDGKVKKAGKGVKDVKTANQAFAKEVTGWTFNEIGVLKVGKIEHHLSEGGIKSNITNPKIYRVKNDVVGICSVCGIGNILISLCRLMILRCPNTLGISGFRSFPQVVIPFNWNSPCCPHSIGSLSSPRAPLPHLPSSPLASGFRINMASLISRSTISGHSFLTLRRRIPSQCDTLLTMNGQGVGLSAMLGHGSLVLLSRLRDGWHSLDFGYGVRLFLRK